MQLASWSHIPLRLAGVAQHVNQALNILLPGPKESRVQLASWSHIPLRLAGVARHANQALTRSEQARPLSPAVPAQKRLESPLRLEVEVLDTPEGVRVRLRGEAGIPEAAALEAAVLDLVARRPACVTFEMSELLSISRLAMDVLAAFCRAAGRAGVRVCLTPDLQSVVRAALNRGELLGLFKAVDGAEACTGPETGASNGRKLYPDVDAVQRTFRVAWGELVELEPQLETLLELARRAGASCRTFTDVDRVFGPVRNALAELIGFAGKHHSHPVLGSVGALEVAYWKLYDAVAGRVAGRAAGAQGTPETQRGGL
jgi:hypothetical protein